MPGCTTSGNTGDDERATGSDANWTHVIKNALYAPAHIALRITVALYSNAASRHTS